MFSQRSDDGNSGHLTLETRSGEITLKEFAFSLPPSLRSGKVSSLKATLGGESLRVFFKQDAGRVTAAFLRTSRIIAGEKLEIDVLLSSR
jgi:hypothetical protein